MHTLPIRKIRFLDLRVRSDERKAILEAIDKMLQHGRLVLGPEVHQFETCIAKYCFRKFGVGMNSGTDALFLALKALNIGPGEKSLLRPCPG